MRRMDVKNRKWKGFACLLLCVMAAVCLAGCGCGKKKADSKEKTESKSKTEADGDEDTADSKSEGASDAAVKAGTEGDGSEDSAQTGTDNPIDTTIGGAQKDSSDGSGEVISANTMEVSSETKKSGEEFVITIQAGENTPVAAYGMELSYDSSKLQVVEYGRTEAFEAAYSGMCIENDKGGVVVFAGASASQSEQYYTGDMFYVKFKAIGESGSVTDVKLDVTEAVSYDGEDTADKFTVRSGTVTIE